MLEAQRRTSDEPLAEALTTAFAVVRAHSPHIKDALWRLRYQIYCVENQFENAADFPDGRETDEHDPHCLHAALVYRPLGAIAGGVRLIIPRTPEDPLPMFTLVGARERAFLRSLPQPLAEISRYAVAPAFRRRSGERQYADVNFAHMRADFDQRRVLPHITLGLMRAILVYGAEHKIRVLCATMAPALLRLLAGFGLYFEPIGPLVAFHGLRQPCYAYYSDLVEGLRRRRPDFY